MMSRRLSLPVAVVACVAISVPGARGQDSVSTAAVDSVFDDLDRTDRPGCAVSVTRGGRPQISRGYGMANLEYGVPVGPRSVFHVASVSKHFTAFAVALLVEEGRVSWDDDIREYVPELPDTDHPITLDHLVHHTSGVRDQWELLIMGGWRWEADLVRQRDALNLMTRQPTLNFPPGTDWAYSNSGYTLLAAVVEGVTGQSLAAFAEERIFGPLEMHSTHFHDDHQRVVPDRAYGYAPSGDGWRISIPDFAIVGATSLFTTVEDMARWARNFETAEVGGRRVVDGMLHRIRIDGEEHGYAHGLFVGDHRGLRTVAHGGADAGYRAHFLRYPDEGLAVSVLCNDPTAGPADRARSVAELYLAEAFSAPPASAGEPGAEPDSLRGGPDAARSPDGLVGWYASAATDLPVRISHRPDEGYSLAIGNRSARRLVARSDSVLEVQGGSPRIVVAEEGDERVRAVLVDDGAGEPRRYLRAAAADTSRASLEEYAGWYWSDAVETLYQVRLGEDGRLELRHRRHGTVSTNPMHRDAFSFRGGFLGLTFTRNEAGAVDGLTMSGPRTWKVRFRKTRGPVRPDVG